MYLINAQNINLSLDGVKNKSSSYCFLRLMQMLLKETEMSTIQSLVVPYS